MRLFCFNLLQHHRDYLPESLILSSPRRLIQNSGLSPLHFLKKTTTEAKICFFLSGRKLSLQNLFLIFLKTYLVHKLRLKVKADVYPLLFDLIK